jgi:uncharacterized membrane protein YeaQ/YmgE (transglycosylase-associated protein family)
MWSFPARVLVGFLIGTLIGWLLTYRVSVADSVDRMMFAVGIGLCGAVVGGVLKRLIRR